MLERSYRRNNDTYCRDPNTLTLDSNIKIRIDEIGTFIPELNTTSPTENFITIEQCINIMNRGTQIDIINIPYNNGVNTFIENFLLNYNAQNEIMVNRGAKIVDVSEALNSILKINNKALESNDKYLKEEGDIFNINDLYQKTANGIDNDFSTRFYNMINGIDTNVTHGKDSDPRKLLRKKIEKEEFDKDRKLAIDTTVAMSNLYNKFVNTEEDFTIPQDNGINYSELDLS